MQNHSALDKYQSVTKRNANLNIFYSLDLKKCRFDNINNKATKKKFMHHTVILSLEMIEALHVSSFWIFCVIFDGKYYGKGINQFVHCPFE